MAAKKIATRTKRKAAPAPPPPRLFNRELSWLEFNRRVLAQAEDPATPLLERLKFLSIASNNLDEFLMVRLGAIRELIARGITERSPDGMTPKQQLRAIRTRVKLLLGEMYDCLAHLMVQLRKHGVRVEPFEKLPKKQQAELREWFTQRVAPVLTPLAVDPGHPFPFLGTRSLNLATVLRSPANETHIAFIKVPPLLPRFITSGEKHRRYVPIESIIAANLGELFPGLAVVRVVPFRVIRNADINLDQDEVEDLLKSIESELRRRDRREVVWIELGETEDATLLDLFAEKTHVTREDIFFTPGLPKLNDLFELYAAVQKPSLKDEPFTPHVPPQLASSEDIFSIIRSEDLLLHRPYDSFATVVEFVRSAAEDPDVVAIKQTLYRTDTGSPIVEALAIAAERGKQVTAIVELQARFDEMKNITWARRLEEAGVQVVYGLVGLKTHCKLCLVVRREAGALRRYVHLSTGNYNAQTARLYTDLDLLTADDVIGEDAAQVMNFLTGYSATTALDIVEKKAHAWHFDELIVAPIDYHGWVLRMIEREKAHALAGRPAQIIAKMNSLVDPAVIESLYAASAAGVKIDLAVRGICCLVPGVPGMSERIRVVSIVDRFLEHARVFLFRNGGDPRVWVSSGDWMPRNFFRRVEVTFPVRAEPLRRRVEEQILAWTLADNVSAWKLLPDGTYRKRTPRVPSVRSQQKFIDIALEESTHVGTYEEMLRAPSSRRKKAKRKKRKN